MKGILSVKELQGNYNVTSELKATGEVLNKEFTFRRGVLCLRGPIWKALERCRDRGKYGWKDEKKQWYQEHKVEIQQQILCACQGWVRAIKMKGMMKLQFLTKIVTK